MTALQGNQRTIEYYNAHAEDFAKSTVSVDFHEVQDRFLVYLPAGAKILDFGCGAGRDAKYFADKGYEVMATDGSEELCKVANQLAGVTVRQMLFTELNETESYDGIWACASILHLRKEELAEVLPKMIGTSSNLKKEIRFQKPWIIMIQDNAVAILGWIQYEKVKWLQNNNPEVPGLVYKLMPMDEKMRKLGHVRRLWEGILTFSEVRDVFTDKPVQPKEYDVDHFIPWSFVMNDELWNLMPMDSSLNSSKSNRLPKWDPFFVRFADNQYLLYRLIHEKEPIRKLFEACYRDNLHSIWAGQELYVKGNTKEQFYNVLQKNMRPVYDSAKRQGYEVWGKA